MIKAYARSRIPTLIIIGLVISMYLLVPLWFFLDHHCGDNMTLMISFALFITILVLAGFYRRQIQRVELCVLLAFIIFIIQLTASCALACI